MIDSIYGGLPPLRCNYNLVAINEEEPYIAMEELGVDGNKERSPRGCCWRGFLDLCCMFRTK